MKIITLLNRKRIFQKIQKKDLKILIRSIKILVTNLRYIKKGTKNTFNQKLRILDEERKQVKEQ